MEVSVTPEKQRTGLRGRKLQGKLLSFALSAEDELLRSRAGETADGLSSKTLLKQGPLRMTLVALRKGAALKAHQVAGPISIQVLRGALELDTADAAMRVERGSLITLEANAVHAATALTDCAILLTITMP